MSSEFKDALKTLIAELKKDQSSVAFHEPVPWQDLGLWNYLQVVKKPMDMDTLRKNLIADVYKSVDDFSQDLQQIWTNCKLYNQ